MSTSRIELGVWSIAALVLLRLAIGWHFFQEGTQKFVYDEAEGRFQVVFTAEGFMRQATGPFVGLFHAQVPDIHGWPKLLAVARENKPPTADDEAEPARWQAEYQARRDAAAKNKQPAPLEFSPLAPYHDWAQRIVDDWRNVLAKVTAIPGLSDDQRWAAAGAFIARQQQLADYLAAESDAIADYQHELWRLQQMRTAPESQGLPYEEERIAAKTAETRAMPLPWLAQVQEFQAGYDRDLRDVLTAEQKDNSATVAALDDALTSGRERWIHFVNVAVTVLTLSVGACLLVGLLTRIAAVAGAGFLLAIIATQPPWVAGAEPTYYQCVELAGLLVLAATGAGRWAGLDFFVAALCRKLRRRAAD